MFHQSAYSDPDIMRAQLKEYIESKHTNLGWNRLLVDDLKEQVDISFDNADSWYKFNETIVHDGLNNYLDNFIRITMEFTNNPASLPNYEKVLNALQSIIESQHGIDQLSGIELAQNVTRDQVEEASKKMEQSRDEALDKYIPWVIGGAAAYFILPKLFSTYLTR